MKIAVYVKFLRKVIKRTYWRMTNLSARQFWWECVCRQFRTVTFDTLPHYEFPPIPPEELYRIALPQPLEFFVMIKPSGIPQEAAIRALIAQAGLTISHEETYDNFFEIAAHIFRIDKIHDYRYALPEGYIWLRLLEHSYPQTCQQVKILYIRNSDEATLKRLKTGIRRTIGVEFYRVRIQGAQMVTCMTPVHTSDQATLEQETRILRYFDTWDRQHPAGR